MGKESRSILIVGLFLSHNLGFFYGKLFENYRSFPGIWDERTNLDDDHINFLLVWAQLTSQVMTSSDLLPPPPLTLAGVTSGTAKKRCQGCT